MQRSSILKSFEDLEKAISLLKRSLDSYLPYDPTRNYSPEELEKYDALSFRFEKAVELTLSFFKSLEIYLFGEASDTLRNRLLRLQRAGFVDEPEFWFFSRLLRNKIAHAYLPEELEEIYTQIVETGFQILEKIEQIKKKIAELP